MKHQNVVKILMIWRGFTDEEQASAYDECVKQYDLGSLEVVKWEDLESGGEHNWFIFHDGPLADAPKNIIDDLIEAEDTRFI